ncbi:homeobox-DDT domain protein RLT2-like [Tasmannia lanceolata]|uniref:homeobox-DDT domain protein RLT2-like n=1 Tax=Tasmannia lanceolata TaxID=3420 RepID=UPI0040648C75
MEADEGEKKQPPEGEKSTKRKRKMKTPSQLELLEKTYAVEAYPSETLRAELSVNLGLADRELQMWFCHRRLKDRKVTPAKRPRKGTVTALDEAMMGDQVNDGGSGSGSSAFGHSDARKVAMRIGGDLPMMKRYYEPPQSISELRAIAFVESQLGEALREDGPILGMEFDPLPPDAFGAPLEAIMGQQNQAGRPYESKVFERQDANSIKTSSILPNLEPYFAPSLSVGKRKQNIGSVHVVHSQSGARALHEYQFLPEQPIRSETYERVAPSHFYDSSVDPSSAKASPLSTGEPFLHGNEQMATGYGVQGQLSSISLLSQQGRQGRAFSSGSTEYDSVRLKNSFMNIGSDAQLVAHPDIGLESPFVSSDRRVGHDEDASLMERKQKNEEARIAKEVEAHEKRIRKELEKQDILRRKREEQLRREMEKHDRERKKEEERLMREKQREDERFQREQKRENERRERFLQKESLRAEKVRQKEELRLEKEAARLKAANERATARRIARESMELIEDERLELMELAASSKGLRSIVSLDSVTLEQLELFRDMLSTFPPKSVQLRRPFAVQPWSDSEENIGNLLMVWRFLITFTDVLGLWPFTLDEFVQALHDYDPRLLGEIHVALLKSVIKDIEDVARTPSIGLGANQNCAANPGGGHPQIVEGAYAWGFDIRSWQHNLNPLTWPEILRQFALSAGFGPQLKKRSVERAYYRDDNEGQDGEDIISTLRNGAAAESAAAVMQEKGFSHHRRSRHRLTPGTVKFAAFHVLSLEGSKGLTILQVADKIQKSGLRNLRTSKTPEASIAAALSRDATLFERTAPSTYCVRPAFRKDPADADAILSAAREKIQIFESGLSDSEGAEKNTEYANDVERDGDSEDDPEIDDVGIMGNPNKEVLCSSKIKIAQSAACSRSEKGETVYDEVEETPQSRLGGMGKTFAPFPLECSKDACSSAVINTQTQSPDVVGNCHGTSTSDQEGTEIDESNSGELWVQGLMEGEYSDLTVEERLNALAALIGLAIEGNSIRVILEERLEAANALKKQMWAETQLDKRRMKEEYVTKLQHSAFTGIKTETNLPSAAVEGSQSPLLGLDNKNSDESLNPATKHEILDPLNVQDYLNNVPSERNLLAQEFSTAPDNSPFQQYGCTAEKSRSQLKSYIGHRAEEMYVYRSLPLGQDRRRNRYWQFVTSSSRSDPGSGRIFFESQDGCWRLIDSEEAFDALLASLDTRGIRESHLYSMMQKIEMSFRETIRRNFLGTNTLDPTGVPHKVEASEMACSPDCTMGIDSPISTVCGLNSDALEHSASFRIELGRNESEKSAALKRYQDLQKWLWKECFNPSILCAMKYGKIRCSELLANCDFCHDLYLFKDKHCPSCHMTFETIHNFDVNFPEHVVQCEEKLKVNSDGNFHGTNSSLPVRIRLLKAQLSLIEASIPPDALQPFWTEVYRKRWGVKLHSSSSAEDIFQLLTLLEGAVKRDCLSSNFETTKELMGSSTLECAVDYSSLPETVPVLPWVPSTTAAVALRLLEVDSSIIYMLHKKVVESQKGREAGEFIKVPSRYAVVKNIQELEPAETPEQPEYQHEDNWAADPGSSGRSLARGRGGRSRGRGRSRGGRRQRGSLSLRVGSLKENSGNSTKPVQRQGQKSQTRGRGRRRGRRTVRGRWRPQNNKVVKKVTQLGSFDFNGRGGAKQINSRELPRREELDGEESGKMYVDENSAGPSDSDDAAQTSADEYDDQGMDYNIIYNGEPAGLREDSEEDLREGDGDGDEEEDGNGDEEGEEDEAEEDEGRDVDGFRFMDEDDDRIEHGDGEGNGDEEDEVTASSSSEYSD